VYIIGIATDANREEVTFTVRVILLSIGLKPASASMEKAHTTLAAGRLTGQFWNTVEERWENLLP
jgi:hypothetical protein